jgi:hypothetical protein
MQYAVHFAHSLVCTFAGVEFLRLFFIHFNATKF